MFEGKDCYRSDFFETVARATGTLGRPGTTLSHLTYGAMASLFHSGTRASLGTDRF